MDDVLAGGVEGADRDDRARMIPKWRRYVRFWGADPAADVDEELQFHIESRVHDYVAEGMTVEAARAEALRRFGDVSAVRRSCEEIDHLLEQERRRADMWEALMQDLRYAARILRRSPALTATAVLTLALGIGANTAVFQLINAVAMRSLPVSNPGELAEVRIAGGNKGFGITNGPYAQLTRPVWEELRAHQEAFSGVFAWGAREVRVGQGSDLHRASALAVSGEFFRVLGVKAFRGRLFEPSDEASSCPSRQAVISYGYWQRELGGRELGRDTRLTVDLEPQEIIGVTPPGFFGLAVGESFDIAVPFCKPEQVRREVFDIAVMGRLRPDWTLTRASAHLDALSTGIFEAAAPTGYGTESIARFKKFRLAAYAGSSGVSWLRTQYDMPLQLLLAITGLVLLIACANLANLMLARATARQHEVAVRLALGASRATLLRQFFVESGVLAASGAVLGIGLAQILSRVLVRALSTADATPTLTMATDWRVLLFTAGLAMATCLVFGIAPALRAARILPASAMKSGGRSMTAGRERFPVQRLMVVTQIAVSLVLLVAALLFVRSFRNLITFDPGFRQQGITVGFFSFQRSKLAAQKVRARSLAGPSDVVPVRRVELPTFALRMRCSTN